MTSPIEVLEPDPLNPSVLRPLQPTPVAHPTLAFMASHPAHAIALGFGSGLARHAPGTVGTLWGWATFVVLQPWLNDVQWAVFIGLNLLLGWWASTVTARHMGLPDSSHMVWDEVVAIWLVMWVLAPASLWTQVAAFALFRFFDAVKFGPMAWADQAFKGFGPRGGFGVMLDDLAAAFCTLLVIAWWRF
jgi:phosphatidylglycerophosphatase A